MPIDIDHLRTWIGRSVEARDVVTPRLVAEHRSIFEPRLAPVGEGEAPLAFHWVLSPVIAPLADIEADGHARRGDFLPPVPLPRRMWAGGDLDFRRPIRIGDTVTRRSTIEEVSLKEGRTGRLCFVTVRHDHDTGRGIALSERHDIVYRVAETGRPSPARPATDGPGPRPDLVWTIDPSPVLLFRFSAASFNSHRIHYDAPYATGQEGYRGLVVHGPFQATLLVNIVATLVGRIPVGFRYRGVAPLIADAPMRVCAARASDGTIAGWTEDGDGRRCMECTAS